MEESALTDVQVSKLLYAIGVTNDLLFQLVIGVVVLTFVGACILSVMIFRK